MGFPAISSTAEDPAAVSCDCLVVPAVRSGDTITAADPSNILERVMDNASRYLASVGFSGKVGELVLIPAGGRIAAPVVAVAGIGKGSPAPGDLRRAAGAAARRTSEFATVATTLGAARPAAHAVEGFLLGHYRFLDYKSEPKIAKTERVVFLGTSQEALDRGRIYAEAVARARDLVNRPASERGPEAFADAIAVLADRAGIECEVWRQDELERHGFNGVLAVGRGSANPPVLVRLAYRPEAPRSHVALVGKGITFDSGGLSIKDAKNMETMKTDMAGAAAVVGVLTALPELGAATSVTGWIPAAENMPGSRALKPGDVIRHYGGRTTEVLNTDAEGRLVLADALARASEEKPEAIVDLATLTGSIMVALGKKLTGLFSNDLGLRRALEDAARASGEGLWPMPLHDDYKRDLDSEIADRKNIGTRYGGSIVAALFLSEFVGADIPWAHLDIAGTARSDSDTEDVSKGATGVGVRTLLTWIGDRT